MWPCELWLHSHKHLFTLDYIFNIKNHIIEPCLLSFPDILYLSVPRCWITDNNIHFIVNIGYYVLVFLFTFTTFIIILSWLFCLRRTKGAEVKMSSNSKNILTILGLCCMLGITWGFAFFAYGVLRIPSYYIFTVLNSFQGIYMDIILQFYNNLSIDVFIMFALF